MEDDQQFCLRWNNHQSTLISVFDTLLENETLVDCTIAAEGRFLKAHKVVLSACSPYFATLLQEQYDKHPIFILKDVKFQELRAMMDYMYRGEVNISQDQLAALLKAAESLQIKGLSDSRGAAPRQEQPPRVNVPIGGGNKNSYTLETKRVRIGPGPLDSQDISGSREGSSSPSRRRRKVRRRSMENDVHDNSNSSITPQNQGSNATLSGVSAITAAALASQMTVGGAGSVVSPAAIASAVVGGGHASGTTQQLTTNVPKKTDPIKSNVVDAINTADGGLQTSASGAGGAGSSSAAGAAGVAGSIDDQDAEHIATASAAIAPKEQKPNHKQKSKDNASTISPGEMAIEPKSEYDEEANEESVEDLTMDDEMGMDDLDHNAGTSQGGEGSSQEYAWQHDRSQDGLLLTTQETQQRDPQDLSITRIAGLSWKEWNARLAMPLVTQLHEGAIPLVFPTDLSLEKQQQLARTSGTATPTEAAAAAVLALATASVSASASASKTSAVAANASGSANKADTKNSLNNSAGASAGAGAGSGTAGTSGTTNDDSATGNLSSSSLSGSGLLDIKKTPKRPSTPETPVPSDFNERASLTASSPRNCSDVKIKLNRKSEVNLQRLTEEEARTLMWKAAAEKANKCANISDISYGDDNLSACGDERSGGTSTAGNSDYHNALSVAGAIAGAADILNSLSAMKGFINSTAAGNGTASTLANALSRTPDSSRISNSASSAGTAGETSIGGLGHSCPECGRLYKLKSSLRNHQKWECGKEPQFQCPFCVYRAKQKMHIGRHMERMHKEKFIKLEDFKNFTQAAGLTGDDSSSAAVAAAQFSAAAAELRQHFQ